MRTLNEYQTEAAGFAKHLYDDYPFMALGEEVGEVFGKIAKYGRKNDLTVATVIQLMRIGELPELLAEVEKELGDVLWQLARCAGVVGLSLGQVAATNIDKLTDRDNRGVIVGEGDNR